jgi:hypothetical protein
MKKIIFCNMILGLFCALQSCAVYDKHELPQYKIGTLKDVNYRFFAIDQNNKLNRVWMLENVNVKQYEVTGYIRELSGTEAEKILKSRRNYASRKVQHNVLLYINDSKIMEDDVLVHLDYTNVQKAEVYEVNQGKSVFSSYISVLGVPLAALSFIGILAVIISLLAG